MSDVNFILIYVDDVAASEAFYTSILGRGAVESSPTFAMMPAAPGLMLGLWKREGVKPKATPSGGGEIAFADQQRPAVGSHDEIVIAERDELRHADNARRAGRARRSGCGRWR